MMFGKKTADDVLKLFAMLSDEEKEKVLAGLKRPETEDEEQIAEAEEHIEEKGEENGTNDQTEQDVEDESVGEQEHLDGNEDSLPAEERIEESESAEAAAEENAEPVADESADAEPVAESEEKTEDFSEVLQMLAARVEAAEAKIAALEEALSDRVARDNDQDFGSSPSAPASGEDGSRMADVMYNYAGNAARRYL